MMERLHNIKTCETRVSTMRGTFCLFDHYFLAIDDTEYHLGYYPKGTYLPKGTTKNSKLTKVEQICELCYIKLIINIETGKYKRDFNFFPFINCETLTHGFSIQSLLILSVPFAYSLLYLCKPICALILLLVTIILLLWTSKYVSSRIHYSKCVHLHSTNIYSKNP